jgi:hypothetical protein
VVLSLAAPALVMKALELEMHPERQHQPALPLLRKLANTIHMWAAYRESKTIYRIEPYLAECLSRTSWPDDVPAEALRLPSYCPILEFPWEGQTTYIAVTYDIVPFAPAKVSVNISHFSPPAAGNDRELISSNAVWEGICVLSLVRGTLAECVEHTARMVNQTFPGHTSFDYLHNGLAGFVITLLLYLAGEPDIVRLVHPGEKPEVKPSLQKRDPERFKDLREPTINLVGTAFTRAIERWEIEEARERGEPTGRTVQPHTRRAHAHLYWTGEGRRTPRVRFLLPISVKGGKLVEEPETPRVAAVS